MGRAKRPDGRVNGAIKIEVEERPISQSIGRHGIYEGHDTAVQMLNSSARRANVGAAYSRGREQ